MLDDRDGGQWLRYRWKIEYNRNIVNTGTYMSQLGFYKILYDMQGEEYTW